MLERLKERIKRRFGKEKVASPEVQYHIRIQDGDRFWVNEKDYLGFWKDTSMLEMKRQTMVRSGDQEALSISLVVSQEFQESWEESGKVDQLKQKGIEIVWAEEDKILETPFPQQSQ